MLAWFKGIVCLSEPIGAVVCAAVDVWKMETKSVLIARFQLCLTFIFALVRRIANDGVYRWLLMEQCVPLEKICVQIVEWQSLFLERQFAL